MNDEDLKKNIKAEVAAALWNELIDEMSEKCFNICLKKPGVSLDSYEQRCLSNCMDRFIDSYNTITRTFMSRVEAEANR